MILRTLRISLSASLGLAVAAFGPSARADAVATPVSLTYNSMGSVTNNGVAGLVAFNGTTNESYNNNPTDPHPINNQLNFGNFLVSNAVDNGNTIKTLTNISNPFTITNMIDSSNGFKLTGNIAGTLGNPSPSDDHLAATINSVSLIGNPQLALAVPVGTPINLNLANGTNDGSTALIIGAVPGITSPTPAPEPASIVMFATLVGGLGFWHRRRAALAR